MPKRHPRFPNRPCLLFRVYANMRGRAHGGCTKSPWVYARGWPWKDYAEFRAWALASGFSKATPSPDRKRTHEPYGPNNVEWVTKHKNHSGSSGRAWYMRGHDDVRGEEPPLPPLVDERPRRHRTGIALGQPNDVPF